LGLAASNDRSHQLLAAPRLQPIAPIPEITLVRVFGRQMNHAGKAHCSKVCFKVARMESAQPWLTDLGCSKRCGLHRFGFDSHQGFLGKNETKDDLAWRARMMAGISAVLLRLAGFISWLGGKIAFSCVKV
jgi:hypothetical protein